MLNRLLSSVTTENVGMLRRSFFRFGPHCGLFTMSGSIPRSRIWPVPLLVGQPAACAEPGDCVITSLRKMYVCVSTFVGRYPGRRANARSVVVLLIVIGPVYSVLFTVGVVPSVV